MDHVSLYPASSHFYVPGDSTQFLYSRRNADCVGLGLMDYKPEASPRATPADLDRETCHTSPINVLVPRQEDTTKTHCQTESRKQPKETSRSCIEISNLG
ncbi:hypothetical protein AVEN_148522-1 [Araneus ventricosus]|uniref:Uncharacterized protein n=1 Tax=Araneus ventricosus TaxID=182803 RepID=A0A4Y2WAY8_ARAVE|nr:hypothetical protein AVEN_148522-1 [Araneus ventricosus]